MWSTPLLSAALMGVTLLTPAFGQQNADQNPPRTPQTRTWRPGHVPGVGVSEPFSTQASHIQASRRSTIAPRLPTPPGGENASPDTFLHDAQAALRRHRTGEAQEALERAETALLNDPANPAVPDQPTQNRAQQTAEQARQALGKRDIAEAQRLIDEALPQATSRAPASSGQR